MAYEVLRTESVGRTVEAMTARERRTYDAAVDHLRGEGCKAGGYRLAATNAADYPMCCRYLYGSWRMHTVFRSDGSIVIVSVARHDESENPNRMLAELFPGLSPIGRRRSDRPPCCEDPDSPPVLSKEQEDLLRGTFGI